MTIIRLWDKRTDERRDVDLEEYLLRVGEVPALWPLEVVKAQVVLARSYAAAALTWPRHGDAHLCTDAACCQAWGAAPHERREQAIADTRGLVLWYVGERQVRGLTPPLVAVPFYHARCGGHTGEFQPLVAHPDGGTWLPVWTPAAAPWMKAVPCPCREIPDTDGKTERRGHGFGLCQYGARWFAERGYPFNEILAYYYNGCAVGLLGWGPGVTGLPESFGMKEQVSYTGGDQ